jgi:hypothetical protein
MTDTRQPLGPKRIRRCFSGAMLLWVHASRVASPFIFRTRSCHYLVSIRVRGVLDLCDVSDHHVPLHGYVFDVSARYCASMIKSATVLPSILWRGPTDVEAEDNLVLNHKLTFPPS